LHVASGLRAAVAVATVAAVIALLAPWAVPDTHASSNGGTGASLAATAPGYDISWPQCGGPYPADPAFGVVGVNKGIVYSPNPCLASEVTWAGGAGAGLYANTANPGPALSSHWPTGQTSPRVCSAANPDTAECAYDYGYNAAADSYADAVAAFSALGLTESPADSPWWLDIEISNSWRSDVALNVAALSGAVDYLGSVVHVPSLGFYSTSDQWGVITGGTSTFSAYPSWVTGAADAADASANCGGLGFTGGGVALAQYPSDGFDANLRCSPVLTSILVSPATVSVQAGGSVQFGASGHDQYGQTLSPQSAFSWSVSGGGTVDASGRFTAGSTAGGPFTVTASGGGVTGTAHVTVTSAPDFSVSMSPTLVTIGRGGTATYTVTIAPIGGFAGSVALAASGAPAGATVVYGTNPTGGSSTLRVKSSRTGPKGTFTLTVTGSSGTLVRTTTATLKVTK
jgi:hypothetical protein